MPSDSSTPDPEVAPTSTTVLVSTPSSKRGWSARRVATAASVAQSGCPRTSKASQPGHGRGGSQAMRGIQRLGVLSATATSSRRSRDDGGRPGPPKRSEAPSEVLRWSGDGAHVGQVGAGLVVGRGVGVDDGAQDQPALQLDQPRGQRRQVADAQPRIEHGARRDIQRRLLDLGRQLGGAGLVEPRRTGRALRTLHPGQTDRTSRAGLALHALRPLQAADTSSTLLAPQTGQALHTARALFALLAGLPDHAAWALGTGQALLTARPLLTGHAPRTGLAARPGQAGRALLTLLAGAAGGAGQTLLAPRAGLPFGALLTLRAGLALRTGLAARADRTLLAALTDRADRPGRALLALVTGLTGGAGRALLALVTPLADRTDRALGTLVAGLAGGADRTGRALHATVALLDGDVDGNRNGLTACRALRLRHGRSWPLR